MGSYTRLRRSSKDMSAYVPVDDSPDTINTEDEGTLDEVPEMQPIPKHASQKHSVSAQSMPRRSVPQKKLSKYGVAKDMPELEKHHAPDDRYSFLEQGRDIESVNIPHKYTEKEKEALGAFESLDYLPSHSDIFKKWVKRQRVSSLNLDVWFMMALIGFSVGVVGFLLHQVIEEIADLKWETTEKFLHDGKYAIASLFAFGYSLAFVLFSAFICVYIRPETAGSGIPEITGFLNGTNVRHIFNIRTMIVKFLSCVTAVGSGLPVGPEGPMIHLGALVGAGLSQFKSESLRFRFNFFEKFRTTEARRNFVSAGAAAGVASAFGAPVGGLLFSMEEVSSFWTTTLSWQIFFCCMVSTFTTDLFNSAFQSFSYTGSFGQFKTNRYILFQIDKGIDVNILMFIPTAVIGLIGGVLGALFTILCLKMTRIRLRLLSKIERVWVQKIVKLFEPAVILIIVTAFSLYIPSVFTCTEFTCIQGDTGSAVKGCFNDTRNPLHVESEVASYTCPNEKEYKLNNNTWMTNRTYNEVATLLFGDLERAVKRLFSRDTHLEFSYASLFTVLPFYFLMICWASGTAVACGTLVPMLLIGSLYGRIIGITMTSMFGIHSEDYGYWAWLDPGAFALIGAASFFGGVTRLTLAVTVIMMELTNDVQVLLPVMVSVMVAKWVGDLVTHPVYHAQMEVKCIPFLDQDPKVSVGGKLVNLENYSARDVMASPVITIQTKELVQVLSNLLLNTTHGGFPVVMKGNGDEEYFYGLITRLELTVLLMHENLFVTLDEESLGDNDQEESQWLDFDQLNIQKLHDPQAATDMLNKYLLDSNYRDLAINLKPYINQSALSIPGKFSLYRTYIIFRTLGLRHLVVVDNKNHITGIITRKDLMGFNMEEKLEAAQERMLRMRRVGRIEMRNLASIANTSDPI
ncbi:hypothetical protein CHS0354_000361 [Potamilus streckersoni]|uniref:Chloride channel protein n=1 Tax=Potamilus streckersoni TaxID=2493646 RepID=A0AAE0T777_9BIVA|nr:hypothetical protein CHS0354_000361 [Potamilus streckersoni]